ncbi:MAG: hypothetical protein K0Q81_2093, partial [Paenibacillus sp.]|nr:hypothetical protein [Paenibacillus sp.]
MRWLRKKSVIWSLVVIAVCGGTTY